MLGLTTCTEVVGLIEVTLDFMVTIYRVEKAESHEWGPWTTDGKCVGGYLDAADSLPSPYNDGIDFFSFEYVCGMPSLGSLLYHFTVKDRRLLKEEGFVIGIYHAPIDVVKFGRHQVMFIHHRAERVGELDVFFPGGTV